MSELLHMSYEDRRLCELQARVFELSAEYSADSSAVFVRRFMRSRLARRLDAQGLVGEPLSAEQIVREVDSEYGGKAYGTERYSTDELHWMGYIYRCWCCATGESSKTVHKSIGARELRALHYAYHSLDPLQAVARIRDAKGLGGDEVARGVALLKTIRGL